jgi:hypothetical protein
MREDKMFEIPPNYVASGIYICQPLIFRAIEITNPFYKQASPVEPVQIETGSDANRYAAQMRQHESVFPVSRPIVFDFAGQIVEVSRLIKENAYDLTLCPLRGARMVGLQAKLICDTVGFYPFDGTDLSRGGNDDRILNELRDILFGKTMPKEQRRIGVLDTAKGGDSCRELSRLLRQLNDATNEEWNVSFHLVHDQTVQPPRASQAFAHQSKRFHIAINYHPVAALLFEDEAKLLGFDVEYDGSESHVVRLQQDGQILLEEPGKATLFRKAPLDETLIGLVGEEITNQISRRSDIQPVDPDYWKSQTHPK